MNYCSDCGASVSLKVPPGDHIPRHICDNCNTIHYRNPRNIVGCIPEWQGKILLCRRAIEPRHGYWTLPAGFMENGETSLEGGIRETREEANADIIKPSLFCMFSIPHISQVYIMYRGEIKEGSASPGIESLEVAMFDEPDIPWNEIAFPVIEKTLRLYFADKHRGQFQIHNGEITKDENGRFRTSLY